MDEPKVIQLNTFVGCPCIQAGCAGQSEGWHGTAHHGTGGQGGQHQPAGLALWSGHLHWDQAANLFFAFRMKGSRWKLVEACLMEMH